MASLKAVARVKMESQSSWEYGGGSVHPCHHHVYQTSPFGRAVDGRGPEPVKSVSYKWREGGGGIMDQL
jgi:hypothetical protein